MKTEISGGYKTQTITQLGNLVYSYNAKRISLSAFRVYLAALVVVASREAAKRSRPVWKNKKEVTPRFLFSELSELTGCPQSRVRRELRSLEKAGLLLFSETEIQFTEKPLPNAVVEIAFLSGSRSAKRPIPIPRPVLRYLAKAGREATVKSTLAYIVRGLSISRKGEISGKGTAKACWVAEVMGISIRAVRTARAELIALNFIDHDQGSKQWKLNRDGAYFSINLAWQPPSEQVSEPTPCADFARPTPEKCANFAPPYKNKKTPNGSKNQKTRTSGREQADSSGICSVFVKNPTLHDIQLDDLKRLSRLKLLYAEAVAKNWIEGSEANLLKFVSAAVRATRVGREPVRLFVKIIRNQLWHHITQEQEDRAREVLKRSERKRVRTEFEPEVEAKSGEVNNLLQRVTSAWESRSGNLNGLTHNA